MADGIEVAGSFRNRSAIPLSVTTSGYEPKWTREHCRAQALELALMAGQLSSYPLDPHDLEGLQRMADALYEYIRQDNDA
jgi:hypothetical protein